MRRKINLDQWKMMPYAAGQRDAQLEKIRAWNGTDGTKVSEGRLVFTKDNSEVRKDFKPGKWRLWLRWDAEVPEGGLLQVELMRGDRPVAGAVVKGGRAYCLSAGRQIEAGFAPPGVVHKFKLEWLAREILMIKAMNGNLMRVHVHAWSKEPPARNINDPRLAELGDQMGIMFIWPTTAWIREGEVWGIDFEGYPLYMRQVRNHPSIVMWEASNHPDRFKEYDVAESNDYCEKMYGIIYPEDPSRLISLSSHITHMHYGNDSGTVDHDGNPITPSAAWTAPMVTRGNQDSLTGYGKDWSILRTWPNSYTSDFLASRNRAYFNFEHEESIGQPNWNLARGKPWYHLHSYEGHYDKGSIGRKLSFDQWRVSQAWQAFRAYESTKKQRILGYDGFSWCCLHGGANCVTYAKPLMDYHGHAKLAYYSNRMVFQGVLAGSNDADVAYGPGDFISPVIMNLGPARTVNVRITVRDASGNTVDKREYEGVLLGAGRTVTPLPEWRPEFSAEGFYRIEYTVSSA